MRGTLEFWSRNVFAITVLLLLCLFSAGVAAQPETPDTRGSAQWIWAYPDEPAPKNRFTYFRKVVELSSIPTDAALRLAADSTARVWINGHLIRRKVARYHEEDITAEVINAAPHLNVGKNVLVILHHDWGDICTFQRTGNVHAGLYVSGQWVASDSSWRCIRAPQFVQHDRQVVGVNDHRRIRYPQIIDGRKMLAGDLHDPGFNDSGWNRAVTIADGPWPAVPDDVETPGQREYPVRPMAIFAAGELARVTSLSEDPFSVAQGIRTAKCDPSSAATREAGALLQGKSVPIVGRAGMSHYITVDFHRPVHGYPFVELGDAPEGTLIDFGYCELARAQYDGAEHADATGWINPEGVVGKGYADRYITRKGPQKVEVPDERTARWMTVHVHFVSDGPLVIKDLGIVKSQYPVTVAGSFKCGDERIDQIVKLCLIHAEVTMTDAYVDTPGREDGQWIEDARLRALLAARWFGDTKLREFLIRTHAQGQGDDGNFHPFAPSNFPAYPASYDWSVQWVAALYDDYMWTGRTDLVKRYWRNLCRYWDNVLSHVDEEGLWRTNQVLADIRVGMHCEHEQQSSGIVTPVMIERLRWSAEMAEAIGETEQAAAWRGAGDKMAKAFREYHVVLAEGGIPLHVGDRVNPDDSALERGYSQAGQTVAITSGLLTREEAVADLNYAFAEPDGSPSAGVTRWNNPPYSYRALRALSDSGLTERAVAHLIERYAPYLPGHPRNTVPMALQGPYGGPLPEYWVSREDLRLEPGEENPAQPIDETGSHGWGAVPLLWLHDSLLGVRIVEPGGGKLRIAPEAGGLPYVAGHTVTPKGVVWVRWDPQRWKLEVDIPDGVAAELVLPEVCAGKRIDIVQSAGEVERQGKSVFVLNSGGRYVLQVK
jgi:hypothetical protein